MLKQAVLLLTEPAWGRTDAQQATEWLRRLVDNAARYGLREFVLLDRSGRGEGLKIVDEPPPPLDEPGSPSPPRLSLIIHRIGNAVGDAAALADMAPRLDERFLLIDAGRFFDINFLDLLTVKADAAASVARHPEADADPVRSPWGSAALLRRDAVVDNASDSLAEIVSRLAGGGQVAERYYDRPLVLANAVDANERVAQLTRRPAVFLDRDGVLNVDRAYVSRIDQFEWITDARAAVKRFNDAGWYVFVVTNQSGIARGLYPESDVATLHAHMEAELQAVGAHVDRIEYCPYHAEGTIDAYRRASTRRKPGPGMLLACLDAFPVDRTRSFLVGDKQADLDAATAAGLPGYLFSGGSLLDFIEPLMAERNR